MNVSPAQVARDTWVDELRRALEVSGLPPERIPAAAGLSNFAPEILRRVHLADGQRLAYDALVLATGAVPKALLAADGAARLREDCGLDLKEFIAAGYLQATPTQPAQLAAELQMPRYEVSRLLGSLEQKGFVQRTPRGRIALPAAWEHLGLDRPEQ